MMMNIPDYLQAVEDCIALKMDVTPFEEPRTLTFGFVAMTLEEDRDLASHQIYEVRLNTLREHYLRTCPGISSSEFALETEVVGDWVAQTLTISGFYRQRRAESQRIGDLFTLDLTRAAQRGRERQEKLPKAE